MIEFSSGHVIYLRNIIHKKYLIKVYRHCNINITYHTGKYNVNILKIHFTAKKINVKKIFLDFLTLKIL